MTAAADGPEAPELECAKDVRYLMRMPGAHPRRRPTNLSLDGDLVDEARRLSLNLSRLLEERLREVLAVERHRRWLAENEGAFQAYDRFVERHGVFNEDDREW
jgi:antitoxin CcdA